MRKTGLHYLVLSVYSLYIPFSAAQTNTDTKPVIFPAESVKEKNKSNYIFFPPEQLYPAYIANPLRSTFSAQAMFFDKTSIKNTSTRRFDLKVGGRLGLLRSSSPLREWQINLEGGFHGQFDADHSQDNIGWDGIYALSFDVRTSDAFSYRIGVHHISSHIGDELAERTGLKRINYTRQETRIGGLWNISRHWQSYTEIGWGHDLRNESKQRPWRAEIGIQYEHSRYFISQHGLYAGLDLSSYEENDWDINTTLQIGVVTKVEERSWRFGIEYYNGRSQIGEFFQDSESYIGLGLWIDI